MIISVLFLFLIVPLLGIYASSFIPRYKKIGAKCNYFRNNSYALQHRSVSSLVGGGRSYI